MRILIADRCQRDYLAKCYEALRTGLRALFDTRCFGRGYPGYWPTGPLLRTYAQVVAHVFPDGKPDLLLADYQAHPTLRRFNYVGLADAGVPTAILIRDYWDISEHYRDEFVALVRKRDISHLISLFPQPLDIWAGTSIAPRMIYCPACYDPRIFADWREPKVYDVGFLAAGTANRDDFYPERYAIHQKLLAATNLRYLWAQHPGWGRHKRGARLVGAGFSRAINSCKLFVTTGGSKRNAHAKYVEIMASRSLLLADEPIGAQRLGLVDGQTYVKISPDNVLDKIDYYLHHPDEAEAITEAAYAMALARHTCYTRAAELRDAIAAQAAPIAPVAANRPPEPCTAAA